MALKSTEKDWDQIRSAFSSSIMVDTAMSSLAQNLDGPDWPIKGKDETPAKYIDLNLAEAQELLALKGQPAELLDALILILKETMAFDSPFAEMVEQTTAASDKDNPFLHNLSKLGIDVDFPVTLTGLSPETREFCQMEGLATLGQFAVFAQGMSQTIIVGGDFKKLLNALANVDEEMLAQLLPYRRGSRGLHLIEAVAQSRTAPDSAVRVERLVAWFKPEVDELRSDLDGGGSLSRRLAILADPAAEKQVADLLKPYLRSSVAPDTQKAGFFSKFSRLFRK